MMKRNNRVEETPLLPICIIFGTSGSGNRKTAQAGQPVACPANCKFILFLFTNRLSYTFFYGGGTPAKEILSLGQVQASAAFFSAVPFLSLFNLSNQPLLTTDLPLGLLIALACKGILTAF